jgi:hypothetical protein
MAMLPALMISAPSVDFYPSLWPTRMSTTNHVIFEKPPPKLSFPCKPLWMQVIHSSHGTKLDLKGVFPGQFVSKVKVVLS